MAEPGGGRPLINNRILIIIVGAVVGIALLFMLFSLRSCFMGPAKDKGYTVIYSRLELRDSANVVARLKELAIPYEIRDKGATVAVPKEKADEARLGLAEKNLPAGGDVGWEIFDEARMGATDFDRRIQFIRAISGELARTIRQIEGVVDARIQVVLPETRLFEVTKAPVTASVMLTLAPGKVLTPEQINGIVHLVSSSVENLMPENVIIVDDFGNILSSSKRIPLPQAPLAERVVEEKIQSGVEQNVIRKEEYIPTPSTEAVASIEAYEMERPLTPEEKSLLKLQAKDEYEKQLTSKVQELISVLYPPNSVSAQVSILLGETPPDNKRINKLKIKTAQGDFAVPIARINVVVLVDKKIALGEDLKSNTFATISEIIPYNQKRGDKITIKRVVFSAPPVQIETKPAPPVPEKKAFNPLDHWRIAIIMIVGGLVIYFVLRLFRKRQAPMPFENGRGELSIQKEEKSSPESLNDLKEMAAQDPERVAAMLKKWLTEEE